MLTEQEKMLRAKMYLLKMAKGIDPITDEAVAKDSTLQQDRIRRCLLYVAEVLDQQAKKMSPGNRTEGERSRRQAMEPFQITQEQIAGLHPSAEKVTASELAKMINEAVGRAGMKKLLASHINDWLVEKGYMTNGTNALNKNIRVLTPAAQQIGLIGELYQGRGGSYTVILFQEQAQQFVIDHLTEIAGFLQNSLPQKVVL